MATPITARTGARTSRPPAETATSTSRLDANQVVDGPTSACRRSRGEDPAGTTNSQSLWAEAFTLRLSRSASIRCMRSSPDEGAVREAGETCPSYTINCETARMLRV